MTVRSIFSSNVYKSCMSPSKSLIGSVNICVMQYYEEFRKSSIEGARERTNAIAIVTSSQPQYLTIQALVQILRTTRTVTTSISIVLVCNSGIPTSTSPLGGGGILVGADIRSHE